MTSVVSAETEHSADGSGSSYLAAGSHLFGLRLVQYGLLFAANVLASRALGTAGRAQYALPINLATLVWIAVNLSLDGSAGAMLARREVSLRALSRFLAAAALVLGALGAVATLVIGLRISDSLLAHASEQAVELAAVTVPLTLAAQLAMGLLVRLGALRAYGWSTIVGATVQLTFIAVLAATGGLTPARAIGGTAIGLLVIVSLLMVALARRVGARALVPALEWSVIRRALAGGLAVHPATLALQLNLRVDLLIVSALLSVHEAGLYSLSTSLVSVLYLAVWTLTASSAQTQTNAPLDVANRYTLDFVRNSWMFALAAALALAAVAWPLIRLVFGAAWTGSAVPFMVLASATVMLSIEAPVRIMLMRMRRASWISAASCAGMLLNVGLNFSLIPLLGILGAALASVASYSLHAILMLVLFGRASGLDVRSALRPRRGVLSLSMVPWVGRWIGGKARGDRA
ncbi:MAG: polysaccharide biosynthesis C-terminal domain-containing protein [Solirubrobacteraceae bacterium]